VDFKSFVFHLEWVEWVLICNCCLMFISFILCIHLCFFDLFVCPHQRCAGRAFQLPDPYPYPMMLIIACILLCSLYSYLNLCVILITASIILTDKLNKVTKIKRFLTQYWRQVFLVNWWRHSFGDFFFCFWSHGQHRP